MNTKDLLHAFEVAEAYAKTVAPHSKAEQKEAAWNYLKGRLYGELGCPEGFLDD